MRVRGATGVIGRADEVRAEALGRREAPVRDVPCARRRSRGQLPAGPPGPARGFATTRVSSRRGGGRPAAGSGCRHLRAWSDADRFVKVVPTMPASGTKAKMPPASLARPSRTSSSRESRTQDRDVADVLL